MGINFKDNRLLWNKVLSVCKEKTTNMKNAYTNYLSKTFLHSIKNDILIVGVDSSTACTIIKKSFAEIIENAVFEVTETNFKVIFLPISELTSKNAIVDIENSIPKYFTQTNHIQKSLTFENFVEGPSNSNAKRASTLICTQFGKTFYNPLYIQGHSGLGKTHLLHAIGNQIKDSFIDKKVLYCTSQDFFNEYINFTKNSLDGPSLEEYIKTFDILLIDDIQQLRDKQKTLDFFFNIYNYFITNKKQIVITSDCLQNELVGIPDRLITRFLSGLTVSISQPDFSTCKQIFLKKCEFNNIDITKISEESIEYIIENNSSSIRALEGIIVQILFRFASDPDAYIDLPTLFDILQIKSGKVDKSKRLDANKIINTIASYYSINYEDIVGISRKANITAARHIAIYLIRYKLDLTYSEIGKIFSNRDHATIIHSITKVENELKVNKNIQNVINSIQKKID